MGGTNTVIGNWLGTQTTIGKIWDANTQVEQFIFEYVTLPTFEAIFKLLGVTDEDILTTNVHHQRLLDDDNDLSKIMTQVALAHQKTQEDIIDLLNSKTSLISAALTKFYEYGRDKFIDGLPSSNLHGITIDLPAIKAAIDLQYTVSSTLISAYLRAPRDSEHVGFYLQETYAFREWDQYLTYLGVRYKEDSFVYNLLTNVYDVTIFRERTETVETTITITNIDLTTDNRHTYTKTTVSYFEGVESITETNTDTVIPINTETNSYTSVTTVTNVNTTVINAPASTLDQQYIVKYYTTAEGEWSFWLYTPDTGTYPALDNPAVTLANLDMMPVVELRRDGVAFNSVPNSPRDIQTTELLRIVQVDATALLEGVLSNPDAASVQDAYVHFSVDAKIVDPTTALYLFKLFDYSYYNIGQVSDIPMFSFIEGNYNISVKWDVNTRSVHTGVIAPVGTAINSTLPITSIQEKSVLDSVTGEYVEIPATVTRTALILKYQVNDNQYIQYVVEGLYAVTVIRKGGQGNAEHSTLDSTNFLIPLTAFFVQELSPIEQMHIFRKSMHVSMYSAVITHLEWYQTASFMQVINVIVTIVSIVFFWIAWTYYGWWAAVYAGIGIAGGMLLKELLKNVGSPYLKAFITAVYAIVMMMYAPGGDGFSYFQTALAITQGVTEFYASSTEAGMEGLNKAISEFEQTAASRLKEIQDKSKELASGMSTQFVTSLATTDAPMTNIVASPSMMFYRALEMQSNMVNLCVRDVYDNIYNYDVYFNSGVI